MKTKHLLKLSFFVVLIIAACDKDTISIPTGSETGNQELLIGEKKAIETFNNFIKMLNENPDTRSTISATSKVSSVKKISASSYGGNVQTRANSDTELIVYELILENPDETQGFAVVGDATILDEVIAYSPKGSIADTLYNEGLAIYFRDLAMLSEMVANDVTTRADYWQTGWEDVTYTQITEAVLHEWLDYEPDLYHHYAPIDKMETTSAYVPTKWGQGNPYNNRVPIKVTGTQNNVRVGCLPVAVGQIMAYHRYPASYNWGLIANTYAIPPTPLKSGGGIDTTKETVAQKEVSRLLYNIAVTAGTVYKPNENVGSTPVLANISTLTKLGYNITETNLGTAGGTSPLVKEEIANYNRPILYAAQSDIGGHAWIIDAILTIERWIYYSFHQYSTSDIPRYGIKKFRAQGLLMHCNWGWDGSDNGWYFNFTPPYNGQYVWFYYGKYLYTGIYPK